LVFVKYPLRGAVKTRLARTIGQETAVEVYRCLVADTLTLAREAGFRPWVFFHPGAARRAMIEWLGPDLAYEPQRGRDLGERMYGAFQRAFRECCRAVLVGSDTPDLPPALVQEAFHSLEGHDAVLGPAFDGGYYLIGLTPTSLLPALFQGLAWGSALVLERTRQLVEEKGLSFHLLPPWGDIDEYEDLMSLLDRHRDLPPGRLATVDYLRGRSV
jgi:hypothetical protein